MGKQVRYFMLREDEEAFLDYALENNRVKIIQADIDQRAIYEVERNALDQQDYKDLVFWNTKFPLPINYFDVFRPRRYDPDRQDYFESGEVLYSLDKMKAPVVEFWRSKLIDEDGKTVLTKGRLWAEMHWWENDKLMYKGEDFEDWYDSLAKWVRKKFHRIPTYDGYFGPAAKKYLENGGIVRV